MLPDNCKLYEFAPRFDTSTHNLLRKIGGFDMNWILYYDNMRLSAIDHFYVVIDNKNTVIASGGVKIMSPQSVQFCLLCVDKKYRGQGIARTIYKKLLSTLPDTVASYQVISDIKLEELDMWKHWGFEETGRHPDGFGNDEIILTKWVSK